MDGSGCCRWTNVLFGYLAFLSHLGSTVAEGSPGCSLAASQQGGTSPQQQHGCLVLQLCW